MYVDEILINGSQSKKEKKKHINGSQNLASFGQEEKKQEASYKLFV